MEKTRRQIAREKATIGVYQNLLVESSLEDILTFLNEEKTLTKSEETMAFSRWLVETTLQNKESDLPKTIVINEAVLNAKKFCDDDSYKFINGVLGQII